MNTFSITQVLKSETARWMIAEAFPHETIKGVEPLPEGLINTNLKVQFASNRPPVVLRVYRDGPDVCRKELAIYELIKKTVPVARFLHAEPHGLEGSNSFSILEFVEGITFQDLKRGKNDKAIEQAAHSVGKTLAAIGQFDFSSSGRLVVEEEQLRVGSPYISESNPNARLLDQFLESPKCQQRAGTDLVRQVHEFGWSWADRLPDLDEQTSLVHSDFGNRNILVNEVGGQWKVVAVLDWEFAFSGSPLLDIGHFLRYERRDAPLREPYFSQAFVEHGGYLPENWWEIVRVIDLTALVGCLTLDYLPSEVESELLGLIRATLAELS
jgi:aminoglycoside phosphotransferase (APT) family kinase protein